MAPASPPPDILDRATGTLYGLALGDALGMPSQTLSIAEIRRHYGVIDGFVAPFPDHPVSHGLQAGQVTDDTEQAILLARRLIAAPGHFDGRAWAADLLGWERDMRRRGLRDLLGPSSKAALEAIGKGADPGEAAKGGTTNGAAMRIAPVGIGVAGGEVARLVDAVEETCRVTHNTGEAIAGAAAVAAAISARIEGATGPDATAAALQAATIGQARGHRAGVDDMAERIARAIALGRRGVTAEAFARTVGTAVASHEAVPAAFGIVEMSGGDVWRAGLIAANIGDDTDTIGAMACAICGAGAGMAGIPQAARDTLHARNTLPLGKIAEGLVGLRAGQSGLRQEAAG